MSESVHESVAARYEQLAAELELAVRHLRTSARHFRDREVPRACAHAFAAQGHMRTAQQQLDDLAIEHAAKSVPGD